MEKYFKENEFYREVREGEQSEFTFETFEYAPKIKTIKPSCRCVKALYDPKIKGVRMVAKGENIPKHLRGINTVTVRKFATVTFEDGVTEVIMAQIKIKR